MGLIASAIFWTTAALSIAVNPWFDFFRDAFSDLGGPGAGDPWIYNTGLIVAAVFLGLFSMDIIASSSNKLEAVGGAYISISAVFLALIGIYHAGTRPHVFVSTWFFIQAFLGFLIYGLGLALAGGKRLGLSYAAVFLAALAGALAAPWPSAAALGGVRDSAPHGGSRPICRGPSIKRRAVGSRSRAHSGLRGPLGGRSCRIAGPAGIKAFRRSAEPVHGAPKIFG
jgi:Predicted membrane protein